ncbi:MAG: hypothetical protein WBM32_15900 [Crocosphaera sp.]|jgi:hypothetical protein
MMMNKEQQLVKKWLNLPPEKQQEVMDFVEFIELKILQDNSVLENQLTSDETKPKSNLGKRLRTIREEVVASGVHLLNSEEIEQERKERQGGYQGD